VQAQNTRYQAREGSVRVELLAAVPKGRQVSCCCLFALKLPLVYAPLRRRQCVPLRRRQCVPLTCCCCLLHL
jgi:hypothetical protein